jgi:hypothetical protein
MNDQIDNFVDDRIDERSHRRTIASTNDRIDERSHQRTIASTNDHIDE